MHRSRSGGEACKDGRKLRDIPVRTEEINAIPRIVRKMIRGVFAKSGIDVCTNA